MHDIDNNRKSIMNTNGKFDDAPNAACITTTYVVEGSPILRVYHDYDGGWQFHGAFDQPATPSVALIVTLKSMVDRDSTLNKLSDLPHGWRAERTTISEPWQREKNHPFPTFSEDGYYLEDALWMTQFRDDVNPPPEDVRENLSAGAYVKLIFRFAAENADRQDYDTERMWVLLTGQDDDEYYEGTLANNPHHDSKLACGDTIHFHTLHVMEVLEGDSE